MHVFPLERTEFHRCHIERIRTENKLQLQSIRYSLPSDWTVTDTAL